VRWKGPRGAGGEFQVESDWIVLRKNEEASAEIFFTADLKKGAAAATRPITFVFNGGPGAASA
jgi:carboxypeptidase C (cathepsin A)